MLSWVVGAGRLRGNLFSTLSSIFFSQIVVHVGSASFLPSRLMAVLFVHIMYILAIQYCSLHVEHQEINLCVRYLEKISMPCSLRQLTVYFKDQNFLMQKRQLYDEISIFAIQSIMIY